jgi:RimJ/RimL family protein N-acetyltransferase
LHHEVRLAEEEYPAAPAAYDRPVNEREHETETVILHAEATTSAPALVLRPWRSEDVAALVDVFRDPTLRHWTSAAVENEADALRWIRDQERNWATGDRFAFAVLEAQTQPQRQPQPRPQPTSPQGKLAGHVILKETATGKPSAEVGYWTAAHARGRAVAPRALEALTNWAFDTLGPNGLERLDRARSSAA